MAGRGHPGPEIFECDLLLRYHYLRRAPLTLAGLGAGRSGKPPANGPANGLGRCALRGGHSAPGGVPIPTVAASRDVGDEPKAPVAKMNEPTLTSLIEAGAPDLVKVVVAFTWIVAVLAFGSVTVIVSPLIALTRPAMDAGTMVIDAATLESEELGTTRTFSPSDRASDLVPGRRSVTVVVEVSE